MVTEFLKGGDRTGIDLLEDMGFKITQSDEYLLIMEREEGESRFELTFFTPEKDWIYMEHKWGDSFPSFVKLPLHTAIQKVIEGVGW